MALCVKWVSAFGSCPRSPPEGLREGCSRIGGDYNPYDVVGSGGNNDVLAAAGAALRTTVEDLMHVFGSAGSCAGPELRRPETSIGAS